MSDDLGNILRALPEYLSSHLVLTLCALGLGALLSIPTALYVARRDRLKRIVLGIVGVSQTIPGLALLALMVPLLHAVGAPSFGFLPALLALTVYSLLPILRNTVTGLAGVDESLREAARGLGMSPRQSLYRVELPLALPTMVAGLRIATVWTVGTATLATPIGQESLGNLIFAGLQTKNWTMIGAGVIAAAGLAIALDAIIGNAERAVASRAHTRAAASVGAFAVLVTVGVLSPQLVPKEQFTPADVQSRTHCDPSYLRPLVIGSKPFTESRILADLLSTAVAGGNIMTRRAEGLGSAVAFDALAQGDVGVYVEYTGTVWSTFMKEAVSQPRWNVLSQVSGWLSREHGVRNLGTLGFENAYALAVRRDTAQRLGIVSISDLVAHASTMSIGADYEFFHRPEWRALETRYGLSFAEKNAFDPALQYDALLQGRVDVLVAYTSDGRIAKHDLVILKDELQAVPPYDAILLLSPNVAGCPVLVEQLAPLIGSVSVADMRSANLLVDGPEKASTKAAAEWLRSRGQDAGSAP